MQKGTSGRATASVGLSSVCDYSLLSGYEAVIIRLSGKVTLCTITEVIEMSA
jgi:hypothetical protein